MFLIGSIFIERVLYRQKSVNKDFYTSSISLMKSWINMMNCILTIFGQAKRINSIFGIMYTKHIHTKTRIIYSLVVQKDQRVKHQSKNIYNMSYTQFTI